MRVVRRAAYDPQYPAEPAVHRGQSPHSPAGGRFAIKNRLADAELVSVGGISIDGEPLPLSAVRLILEDGRIFGANQITPDSPLPFPLRSTLNIHGSPAPGGRAPSHFGGLRHQALRASDPGNRGRLIPAFAASTLNVPRHPSRNYAPETIARRHRLMDQVRGKSFDHLNHYSFDPRQTQGNCENFVGVAQVPIGLAGPLLIHGEYAEGEYLIPLATTEGTLVASHNRGMKVLRLCGGVKTTVIPDAMQRAPVFVFRDARAGRDFARWVEVHPERSARPPRPLPK